MIGRPENPMLRAVTGLEGGLVARGSTCGVVSGGILGLALHYEKEIDSAGDDAEEKIMENARDYAKWFEKSFGGTRCEGRSGVNWYTSKGQMRYFFPGGGLARCISHIGHAADKLYSYRNARLPLVKCGRAPSAGLYHCARPVLENVRRRTGVGDPLLEKMSFVLDGGVAYTGGVCGAVAGAVMAMNLIHGLDVRHIHYGRTIQAFVTGHLNLLRAAPRGMPEPFGIGKEIVERFVGKAGSIDCKVITGAVFDDGPSFQKYMGSSARCAGLIEAATDAAVSAVNRWGKK